MLLQRYLVSLWVGGITTRIGLRFGFMDNHSVAMSKYGNPKP